MTIDQIISWEANHEGCNADRPRDCTCNKDKTRKERERTFKLDSNGNWIAVESK